MYETEVNHKVETSSQIPGVSDGVTSLVLRRNQEVPDDGAIKMDAQEDPVAAIYPMNVREKLGRLHRRLLCSAFSRRVPLGARGPIVTVAFDDFPRTALTTGDEFSRAMEFGAPTIPRLAL